MKQKPIVSLDADACRRLKRIARARNPGAWVLPWAILPDVDDLVARELGAKTQQAWLDDPADGSLAVDWGRDEDLQAASALHRRHGVLGLGLVDAAVIATAERLRAAAVATLDRGRARTSAARPLSRERRLRSRQSADEFVTSTRRRVAFLAQLRRPARPAFRILPILSTRAPRPGGMR